jgi:hypothetical protein
MHNKALIRGEDHASVLNRVDGWVSDYLCRFKENPAAALANAQEEIALAFEAKGLGTDLSREMLQVIRGRRQDDPR